LNTLKEILCKFSPVSGSINIIIFLASGSHVRERVSSNKTRGMLPCALLNCDLFVCCEKLLIASFRPDPTLLVNLTGFEDIYMASVL
jgi:hypothetical protein